ncbi:DUF3343 domain-containing protein [Xylocopilactobacillus apicola]|uniref:Putative Se/S carrier protein-like domain-containing protein n=1 Tax=Xylocopilactobacillus apicola TaxID=2932184 RepID=A0AAU9CYV9_9LACO|nr:DUF3343 domain-containing protein [Xylocopilactobacillus apicola]BDR57606.1 hypothetical protein XA3_00470 [Xylocopilactobacillus apicola]
MDDDFGLIVFESTQLAIKAQDLLTAKHYQTRVLTTPGTISAGCGLSIFCAVEDLEEIIKLLDNENAIYVGHKNGLKTHYERIELGSNSNCNSRTR